MGKSKYNELGKNILLFGLSSFGPKLLSFFLVPLYTNCMTTGEFGTADLITTTVTLLVPIFTIDINDAVLRYTINNTENNEPMTIGIQYTLAGSILLMLIMLALNKLGILAFPRVYLAFLFCQFFLNSFYLLIQSYLRAINKTVHLAIMSILNTLTTLMLNIVFLIFFEMGVTGYLLAALAGVLVSDLYGVLKIRFDYHWAGGKADKKTRMGMLKYSSPLVLSGTSWWINTASDKYILSYFCSVSQNGIYSVANKIPSILSIIQSVFSQAWQLSTLKEAESEDRDLFFSKIYRLYSCALVLCSGGIILFSILISKICFAKEFFDAWKYIPLLILATLFIALYSFLSCIFVLYSQTAILAKATFSGAIINTTLNFILIPHYAIWGAVIATLVGYCAMWVYSIIKVRKYVKLSTPYIRDVLSYILLLVQYFFYLKPNHSYISQTLVIGLCCILYWNEIFTIFRKCIEIIPTYVKKIAKK